MTGTLVTLGVAPAGILELFRATRLRSVEPRAKRSATTKGTAGSPTDSSTGTDAICALGLCALGRLLLSLQAHGLSSTSETTGIVLAGTAVVASVVVGAVWERSRQRSRSSGRQDSLRSYGVYACR